MAYIITWDRIIEGILEIFLNIGLLQILRRFILHRPIRPGWKSYLLCTYVYSFVFSLIDFFLHRPFETFTLPGEKPLMFTILYVIAIIVSYISYKIASAGYWKWAKAHGETQKSEQKK